MSKDVTHGFNEKKEKVDVWNSEYISKEFQKVIYKDDIAVIYGKVTVNKNLNMGQVNLYYPQGFTPNNSIIIGKEYSINSNEDPGYIVWIDSECIKTWNRQTTIDGINNLCTVILKFSDNATEINTYDVRIVLMKIPEYIENVNYTLGDVNGDGQITIDDATKIQNYIQGEAGLTAQQFAAADIDKNGKVKASDYLRLKDYVEGTTSSLSD